MKNDFWDGWSELHCWVAQGSLKEVTLLLESKIDVNITNDFGVTPLMVASVVGNVHMVKFLVNNGANKTMTTKNKQTAYDLLFFK